MKTSKVRRGIDVGEDFFFADGLVDLTVVLHFEDLFQEIWIGLLPNVHVDGDGVVNQVDLVWLHVTFLQHFERWIILS